MSRSDTFDAALTSIVRAIAAHDTAIALRVLRASPELAIVRFAKGATRREAKAYYLADIGHYVYPGATALHVAAAAYQSAMVKKLLSMGADVGAKNRRGAEPLHAAAVGTPGSRRPVSEFSMPSGDFFSLLCLPQTWRIRRLSSWQGGNHTFVLRKPRRLFGKAIGARSARNLMREIGSRARRRMGTCRRTPGTSRSGDSPPRRWPGPLCLLWQRQHLCVCR
jgi:hypothetical protein